MKELVGGIDIEFLDVYDIEQLELLCVEESVNPRAAPSDQELRRSEKTGNPPPIPKLGGNRQLAWGLSGVPANPWWPLDDG